MQLLGSINENGELLIKLTIIGFRGETVVAGILDTGFNGAILLPAAIIAELGMDLRATGMSRLADGSRTRDLTFNGKIRWMGKVVPAEVILSFGDETLIGTELLENCKIVIDYPTRQFFIEE